MRPYCMACTVKHLSQAYVLQGECDLGYPEYALGVIGHLSEAAEECVGKYPELAAELRRERQMFFVSTLEGDELYDVPYFDLYKKIMNLLSEDPDCGNCEETRKDFKALLDAAKSSKESAEKELDSESK